MGIGHVAVGLSLKRTDPKLNAGWLIFFALLPDFLLGVFALLGLETWEVPPDYASGHYLLFTFPWSHGLLADLLWSALAGFLGWRLTRRPTAGVAIAIAVLSHFLLDGIVHVRGLPVIGISPVFGLGLWRHLTLELTIEAVMAAIGLWIYRSAVRSKSIAMSICVGGLAAFMIIGQATASTTPPAAGLIAGWILSPVLIAAITFAIDRRRSA